MFSRFRAYFRLSKVSDIVERYFVLNGSDGLFTMMGIIVGSYVAGHHEPSVVLGSGFAGILALGISGSASAYITEKAFSEKKIKKLEESMLISLDNTMQKKAGDFAAILSSAVNGFSPVLTALIMVFPFILAKLGLFAVEDAFISSLLIGMAEIFLIGVFLGRVSGGSKLAYGLRMIAIAFIAVIFSYAVGYTLS